MVLYLDFQIRQNQKNKLKEKNDEYELKNMSYKNTRKYNYATDMEMTLQGNEENSYHIDTTNSYCLFPIEE